MMYQPQKQKLIGGMSNRQTYLQPPRDRDILCVVGNEVVPFAETYFE